MSSSDRPKQLTDMGDPRQGAHWYYTPLEEPELTNELTRLSMASRQGGVDSISFQPCPNPEERTQDRHVINLSMELGEEVWKYFAVFDGHAGHEVADHLVSVLQPEIQTRLTNLSITKTPETVSIVLVESIQAVDNSIIQGLKDVFPTCDDITSPEDVAKRINENEKNLEKILLCMRGSTVLVCLVDHEEKNLWVASLGDSQAVLGWKTAEGGVDCRVMSTFHNGVNRVERERIQREHPGERQCVVNGRVLGSIAVTRAIGDVVFKVERDYTEKVLKHVRPGFRFSRNVDEFLGGNMTPPYVSGVAEVTHAKLDEIPGEKKVLIMSSDGFGDLYYSEMDEGRLKRLGRRWTEVVMKGEGEGNAALRLLRDGMGGREKWSVNVECGNKWMDDVTIVVWQC